MQIGSGGDEMIRYGMLTFTRHFFDDKELIGRILAWLEFVPDKIEQTSVEVRIVGFSDKFEPIPEGAPAIRYTVLCQESDGGCNFFLKAMG